jgi:hypothetical protein
MSKAFQRKLENLESQLLASRSVGVHDWAANELKALSTLIRSTSGAENVDPFPDLTMSSFLSRSENLSPPIIESRLVSDDSDASSPSPPRPNIVSDDSDASSPSPPRPENHLLSPPGPSFENFDDFSEGPIIPSNLYKTKYEPINIVLSAKEISHAKSGFIEFLKQRERQWEDMRDSVFSKPLSSAVSDQPRTVQPDVPALAPIDNNAPIIRSAITSTCLPGDAFKYQRDEIFAILKTQSAGRHIILFSNTNQFSGLYSVDNQIAHRIYSLSETSIPHQIVPGIVLRRFRYTYSTGFVELGNRFSHNDFWDNIDAVTIKL